VPKWSTSRFWDVVERHESLRTVVDGDGAPTQKLLESWSFAVPVLTFAAADLGATLRELSREPFDLTAELRGHGLHAVANAEQRHAR